MNVSGHTAQPPLRLVVSSDTTASRPDRAQPTPRLQLVVDDQLRLQLLETMTLVGSARLQASRRLVHKRALARRALTSLIATSIAIWSWLALNAAAVDPSMHRRLAFVAIISSLVALVLSCSRAEGRMSVCAHQLQVCAAEIGELRDKLGAGLGAGLGDIEAASVQHIRELYRDTMRRCTPDHVYADYLAARLTGEAGSTRLRAYFYYFINVYPRSISALSLPVLFALLG